ncbi:MFS transporter [Jidongwangia harbinensis]|uniref:MFS transporter n=1 Tax=Jidongwangia harbinensis TaxID=2878561 RepID=UPI001CD9DD5F|nr:MFS transporter [Jidongwangia harbinensis]MCA2212043.1 MFS transporter [Jidongwangia harbinensis]
MRALRRWLILAEIAALPPVPRLLVLTQLAFNVGFYLVLPFLADHLADDLGMTAAVVGLVLGLRAFSQQGLFLIGGLLADRFGARPVVLAGCAVRILGFLVLGFAGTLPGVLAGAFLTGIAAALFSPAVESALASEGGRPQPDGRVPRREWFAMFAAAGEVGAVAGPLLGVLLLGVGFRAACLAAAVVFTLILLMHARLLPRAPGAHAADGLRDGLREVAGNRRFLAFTAANSACLLAYHQMYLALPLELSRVGAAGALGWLFALASVQVVLGQVPMTRLAGTVLGVRGSLAGGFAVTAAAFAVVAAAAPGARTVGPAVALVVLLTFGQMLITPVANDVAARLAGERRLGTYFGVLSAAGGVAVLLGSAATGRLFDLLPADGATAAVPWLALALVPAAAAAAMWRLTATTPTDQTLPSGTKGHP